jgi:hypothetical protein
VAEVIEPVVRDHYRMEFRAPDGEWLDGLADTELTVHRAAGNEGDFLLHFAEFSCPHHEHHRHPVALAAVYRARHRLIFMGMRVVQVRHWVVTTTATEPVELDMAEIDRAFDRDM